MSTNVVVNPDQIAISDGSSFLVTARDGSIDDRLPQGFFVRNTRLISYYEISLNRYPLKLLASSPLTHRVALYQFTNPEFRTIRGTVPYGQLIFTVRRDVVGGLHEDIDITNHYGDRVEFQLMLAIRSDFADIFQVKSQQLLARGKMQTIWNDGKLVTDYQNGAFHRSIIAAPDGASSPPNFANGRLVFDVALDPGEKWHACINFIALVDGDILQPRHTSAEIAVTEAGKVLENFLQVSTQLQTSNAEIAATYQQIALCEVQGYVYDAWKRAAKIYEVLGNHERSQKLHQKAADLYQRFNDRFWMEDEGFYCLGLDDKKQQIRAIASNSGHLLWSGIVPPERAKRLVKRLFQPDLWCGWGIRTLSAQNPAYNPISYQLGSVWPHDNGFIAAGLKRYGYHEEANRVAEGIFAAASYFEAGRMPELFAGIERQPESFPVPYPDANIPQAWAAGSIFFFIRTILGLEADAPKRQLRVQPVLPEWLPDVTLTNLMVGDAKVALRFWRDGKQTRWEVTHLDGKL